MPKRKIKYRDYLIEIYQETDTHDLSMWTVFDEKGVYVDSNILKVDPDTALVQAKKRVDELDGPAE